VGPNILLKIFLSKSINNQPPTLWIFKACYRGNFTFYFYVRKDEHNAVLECVPSSAHSKQRRQAGWDGNSSILFLIHYLPRHRLNSLPFFIVPSASRRKSQDKYLHTRHSHQRRQEFLQRGAPDFSVMNAVQDSHTSGV
jgi:hypothetical protein